MDYNFRVIGENIRNLRKDRRMSQEQLIGELKNKYNFSISRNTLSKIENGEEKFFTFDFLYTFAEMFECDIGYLLGEYNETTKELNEICNYIGLSEKAVKMLHTCKHDFTNTLNSLIENYNFWFLLDRISQYRKLSNSVLPFEKWLNEGIYIESDNITDGIPTDLINKRDLALFQIQETIKDIAKDGVDNG